MPISFPFPIDYLSREQFDSVDSKVLRQARLTHRELGRLLEEHSYEVDLAARLSQDIYQVITQMPISVSFGDFLKNFRIDIFADHAIYDIKVASTITSNHEGYMLHYLMMLDAAFGKLINFGTESLSYRIVTNALDATTRRRFQVRQTNFRPSGSRCQLLRCLICDIVSDWGLSLDTSLYSEGIVHLLGGADHLIKRVKLSGSLTEHIGHISLPLLEPDVAFSITTFPSPHSSYSAHLRKIVELARLKSMHWINLGRHIIDFSTIDASP